MTEPLIDFLRSEYDYLHGRTGRDFFLAIESYLAALQSKRRIRRVAADLGRDTKVALERYVKEQNEYIEEATSIRHELAERAPEVDNTDMARPDEATHEWATYAWDSFAGFDEKARSHISVGYPTLPQDHADPGPVGDLLGILRGRLRAAEYGDNALPNDSKIRDDLGDLGLRVSNLAERRSHSLRRYQQESRTLPGVAYARLAHFGSGLNPEPLIRTKDDDTASFLNRLIQDMWTPSRTIRKLVNAEMMEDYERQAAEGFEATLKDELDRLHQELTRRVPLKPGPVVRFLRQHSVTFIVGVTASVTAAVVAAILLLYLGLRE